jgi:CheY-like chemotaxis protein
MARYEILLIGDSTNLLETIGWVLEYKGFEVKTTTGPEAALEAMVRKNYDLIIAKVTTDDREGLDLLQRAKRLNPEVKVMVISGNHDAIFPLEAYELDIDDYLLMPLSPSELWRRVKHCLGGREVMDLQPQGLAAPGSGNGKVAPHMMLMLHDLRGAMVSSMASLKLVGRGFYGEVSQKAKAKLREVTERIDKLGRLAEDFIDKSLAEPRPSSPKRAVVDLCEDVVEPVLAELATEMQNRQVTLMNRLHDHPKGKIPVRGSKMWLKCVFRNLINNGIKYGGRGCTIVVDLESEGANCRLHVHNTGKTVPEASRSLLFTHNPDMRRVKTTSRGLGVGLSLSRDIIQAQGGDIWYEVKNDGSNFVMSIPQS